MSLVIEINCINAETSLLSIAKSQNDHGKWV